MPDCREKTNKSQTPNIQAVANQAANHKDITPPASTPPRWTQSVHSNRRAAPCRPARNIVHVVPRPIKSAFRSCSKRLKSATEVTLEMLRFHSETCRRLGKNAREIHEELTSAWGEDIVGYSTVRRYMSEMKEGRESLQDGRAGSSVRKRWSTTDETIEEARQIVHEAPQITLEDLSDALEINKGSAHTILHCDLSLRSLCARWIPYSLNDSQKASRLKKAKE